MRSGRSPESLAEEFEPSASAIRKWVKQADLDEGHRTDGLTTFERQELRQAKREIKRLRLERDILKKAAAWFAPGERLDPRQGFEARKGAPGLVSDSGDVPCSGSLPQRVLFLVEAPTLEAGPPGRGAS